MYVLFPRSLYHGERYIPFQFIMVRVDRGAWGGAITSHLPTDKPHRMQLDQNLARYSNFITVLLFKPLKYACIEFPNLSLYFCGHIFQKFIDKNTEDRTI